MDDHVTHSGFFSRLLRGGHADSLQELSAIIEDAAQRKIIEPDTLGMIKGVFDLDRLRVGDIMIPRAQMATVTRGLTVSGAIAEVERHGHSRYPVVDGDKDHVVGILLAKELLPYAGGARGESTTIDALMRPPVIVPESKRVDSMLHDFQQQRFHMAVVVDEFGGVCGVVTIEDILELIVGDIDDEDDTPQDGNNIEPQDDGSFLVAGSTEISEFEGRFGLTLPPIDVETVAGVVLHALGHLPQKGEQVSVGRCDFEVLALRNRQITRLRATVRGEEDA
ncbi:MAG: CBS domain-containing protein [Succinivibrionaceae bacterium]|nr:CBS domain-containing protein [Succinivibrionaceae bacterium]